MKKIWIVDEYTCFEDERGEQHTAEGFYATKVDALAAIYKDLADNTIEDEDMSAPNVTQEEDTDTNITVRVNCGERYGMYNWYYVISAINVGLDFDKYREGEY